MKKFLSLVLALIMTMSLVTVSAGAKDFTDDDKLNYEEAVAVMSEIGVIDGYTDGSFKPQNGLTRGAAAKIICNMILGPTTASALRADTAPFKDVAVDNQYAGYIAYCVQQGITAGYTDGTYRPAAPLTNFAFMKMLLGALGYDQNTEGYVGGNCFINVAKQAIGIGLNAGLKEEFDGGKQITREEAALFAFNTLKATMVEYDAKTVVTVGGAEVSLSGNLKDVVNNAATETIKNDNKMQFAEKYFSKLTKRSNVTDDFGRPAVTWINNKVEIGTYVDYTTLAVSYTDKVKGGEVYSDIGSAAAKFDDVTYYIDGKVQTAATVTKLVADLKKGDDDTFGVSDTGVLTEIYVDTDAETVIVVMINTYIAEVTADYNSKKETLSVEVANAVGAPSKIYLDDVAGIEDYKDGDMILVNIADGVIVNVMDPEVIEDSAITKWSVDSYLVTGGDQYDFAAKIKDYSGNFGEYYTKDALEDKTYNVYLDQYGNAIGIELVKGTDKYLFLAGYDKAQSNLTRKTAEAYVIFADGTPDTIKVDFNESNKKFDIAQLTDTTKGGWSYAGADLQPNGDANRNEWFKYTEDDGVYTLIPVKTQVVVTYGTTNSNKTTINCENARVTDGTKVAYGNDFSVYITVDTAAVDTDNYGIPYNTINGISKVTGVYTGVQDVDLILDAASPFKKVSNEQTAAAGDVIYALYGSDGYIDSAIVLGEENDDNSKGYAYALKGADNESFSDGYYYWDFDAVVAGIVDTLTIKTKYTKVIDTVESAIVSAGTQSTWGTKGLLQLTYDEDGYVVDAALLDDDNTTDNIYSVQDWIAESDLNPEVFKAYQVEYAANAPMTFNLVCSGRTLYTHGMDVGLTLASGAPVVVIQIVEDEDGDKSRSIEEYSTIASALDALQNEGADFVGTVAAKLNDKGTAEWIVISSANLLTYEKKASDETVKNGAIEITSLDHESGDYVIGVKAAKEIKGAASWKVVITTSTGSKVGEATDTFSITDYAKDAAITGIKLTAAKKAATDLNVEVTIYDADGFVMTYAEGLWAV